MRPVLVQVSRRAGHAAQGIAEHGRGLAQHHAAELHPPVLDALVGGGRGRRRAHVDGPRYPPAGGELAQIRQLAVELERQGVGPVHVLLDHRHPIVREVARQLRLHARVVDGDIGRQDQRVAVALLPQAVDHRRHQAQHAAGALEFHQGRPVRAEAVEDLGVDRVGGLDALLILGLAALRRELGLLRAVQLGEGSRHHVAVLDWAGSDRGWKSRRRTISKPSSALAGRQEDSTRPTTLRRRSTGPRARGCRPPPRRRRGRSPRCPRRAG